MLLEDLHELLQSYAPGTLVRYSDGIVPEYLDSWRGRYAELTLGHASSNDTKVTVDDLLKETTKALNGEVYHGYKGGEYTMGGYTPVWADDGGSAYSCMAITHHYVEDGMLILERRYIGDYI